MSIEVRMRRTLAGLLGLLLIISSASAQQSGVITATPPTATGALPSPPRDNTQQTGTARIRGRVVATESGEPLRRAMVRVFAPELRESRMAMTDAHGAYELK